MSSAIGRTSSSSVSSDRSQELSWVVESRRGNAQAFNRLVLKWEKPIYSLAFRMLQDREEAEEATQEVFLLAFKGIQRFRQDSTFSTWLYRIALNHCSTRIKQRPSGISLSLDDNGAVIHPMDKLAVDGSQPDELLRAEQRHRVLKALSRLLPEQRAVIELKFYQELTFEEIAEVLAVPLSTIKSRLYSGLEMLKGRLGSQD
ncbi:MAG: sigma-70 family RNA polymerase sigma factor [Acidobacteria bacterium]|nr:sigma-70 family RNA polymerase sigma factor [Acidobacteriota bacterium]